MPKHEPESRQVRVFPVTPETRLRIALLRLNEALAEQKAVIAKWREQLGLLKTSVVGLHGSLVTYHATLSRVGEGVKQIGVQSYPIQRGSTIGAYIGDGWTDRVAMWEAMAPEFGPGFDGAVIFD